MLSFYMCKDSSSEAWADSRTCLNKKVVLGDRILCSDQAQCELLDTYVTYGIYEKYKQHRFFMLVDRKHLLAFKKYIRNKLINVLNSIEKPEDDMRYILKDFYQIFVILEDIQNNYLPTNDDHIILTNHNMDKESD